MYEIRHRETGHRRAAKAISKAKLVTEKDVGDVQREMQVHPHKPTLSPEPEIRKSESSDQTAHRLYQITHYFQLLDSQSHRGIVQAHGGVLRATLLAEGTEA